MHLHYKPVYLINAIATGKACLSSFLTIHITRFFYNLLGLKRKEMK